MAMDPRRRLAICAIAKNEAPYLAEWALYHRMIGVDHILVYNNDSDDETAAVLQALQAAGILETLDWPSHRDGSTQKRAYADGLARLRPEHEWLAYIDIDEFLYVPGHGNDLQAFLDAQGERAAIAVNWKLFGTGGQETRGPGLVVERFTRCAGTQHSGNRAVKTLARTDALAVPNLHNHAFAPGIRYATVHGEEIAAGTGKSATVSHDVICLHHYFTKSREEWDAKVARGRATKPDDHPDKIRKEEHFRMHNRNDREDRSLLPYGPAIRARLAAIPGLPAVAIPAPLPERAPPPAAAVSRFARAAYAPAGEDLLAAALMPRLGLAAGTPGTFVEIGCGAAMRQSLTFGLYGLGWRGLCIDPRPELAADYAAHRPGDIFLSVGIAAEAGELPLHRFGNPDLDTFDAARAAVMAGQARRGRQPRGQEPRPVRPLQAVLDATLPETPLHLLALDVPGAELAVLATLDWDRARPWLVLVTLRSRSLHQALRSGPTRAMAARGYEAVAATGGAVFYADSRRGAAD
ncbi:glycosyltransferase family 2 protein [Roseomonas sp. 18066]|uniref:glycosyltransferase family 2 protein n=1 Tax=Roseomonas sp. 18066 TaxID=2681412 RepID=UPI00135A2188|nr:glycosyltransferase family 2 protein [Roseomonas sp. 18066]